MKAEAKELEKLIRFHETGLEQFRSYYSISSLYLAESTISARKELLEIRRPKENVID